MKHYVTITTENGRQYPLQFSGSTNIITWAGIVEITEDEYYKSLHSKVEKILNGSIFTLENGITFSSKYVVSIQYQQIPDDAY